LTWLVCSLNETEFPVEGDLANSIVLRYNISYVGKSDISYHTLGTAVQNGSRMHNYNSNSV
jgi:hypothetical protein